MRLQNLIGIPLICISLSQSASAKETVNDITQLNPIPVEKVVQPTSVDEIKSLIKNHKGPISVGGGRYSMGGQTATENALQLDMRKFNKILNLDVKNKRITVQTGIRWRDIQSEIDKHNLAIKIMHDRPGVLLPLTLLIIHSQAA